MNFVFWIYFFIAMICFIFSSKHMLVKKTLFKNIVYWIIIPVIFYVNYPSYLKIVFICVPIILLTLFYKIIYKEILSFDFSRYLDYEFNDINFLKQAGNETKENGRLEYKILDLEQGSNNNLENISVKKCDKYDNAKQKATLLAKYRKIIADKIEKMDVYIPYKYLNLEDRKRIFNLTKVENSKDFADFIGSLERVINERAMKAIECDKKIKDKKNKYFYDLENEKMKLLLDQVSYYNLEKEILMYKAYEYILNLIENKAKSMLKIMCYSISQKEQNNKKRERKKIREDLINVFLVKDY